jgi:O-antigen ligase
MLVAIAYIVFLLACSIRAPIFAAIFSSLAFFVNAAVAGTATEFILIGAVGPALVFISIFLQMYFRARRIKFKLTLIDYQVILFVAFGLVTTATADDLSISISYYTRLVLLCISFYAVIRLCNSLPKSANQSREVCLAIAVSGLSIGSYAHYAGASSSEYVMRLTIGEESSIPLSVLMGASVLCCLHLLRISRGASSKVMLSVLLAYLGYILLLTNSRGALVALILSLILVFKPWDLLFKVRLVPLALLISLVASLVLVLALDQSGVFDRLLEGFYRLFKGDFGESETERVDAWSHALKLGIEHPLLGVGPGNFELDGIAYPHNILLEVFAEQGIISLIMLFSMLVTTTLELGKSQKVERYILGSLWLFFLFVSMVSLSLWMHKLLFISMALIVNIRRRPYSPTLSAPLG